MYKLTTKKFIDKAKNIHKDKYDYSLVEYINSKTKVKIICKEHTVFEQKPNTHLSGSGCSKCAKYSTSEDFIKKAKKIHADVYDYSLVKYKNNITKVKIICPIHGIFLQKPHHHLNGCKCQKCAKDEEKMNLEIFISKANTVHQTFYDYSLVEMNGVKEKVKIICPIHGLFKQTPDNHINKKNNCPKCKASHGEKEIAFLLEQKEIKYFSEQRFKDCKDKRMLPFDFYLPEHNTCIEYDGIQHFKITDYYGGVKAFKLIKKHDMIKNEYCKNNNIILIRINHSENIKEKLIDNSIL